MDAEVLKLGANAVVYVLERWKKTQRQVWSLPSGESTKVICRGDGLPRNRVCNHQAEISQGARGTMLKIPAKQVDVAVEAIGES